MSGVGGREAGEEPKDSMPRKKPVRGGELGDDEVTAAEDVAEWGGRRGVRRLEEEAESATMIQTTIIVFF